MVVQLTVVVSDAVLDDRAVHVTNNDAAARVTALLDEALVVVRDAAADVDLLVCVTTASQPVLPFEPKYRLAHPENYLFSLSIKIFFGSKYPKKKIIQF